MEHLSPNMDAESIISTRSSKSLKRNFSNRKTPYVRFVLQGREPIRGWEAQGLPTPEVNTPSLKFLVCVYLCVMVVT